VGEDQHSLPAIALVPFEAERLPRVPLAQLPNVSADKYPFSVLNFFNHLKGNYVIFFAVGTALLIAPHIILKNIKILFKRYR
jgi:hypothetical protein